MSRRSIVASALLAWALLLPASALGGARPSIVGGRAVAVPPYLGFVVAVGQDVTHTCGGTAIRPNVLLTSAHCLVDTDNTYVSAARVHTVWGFDDPMGAIEGPDVVPDDQVAEYVTPSNYGIRRNGATVNDVALLRLREPARGTLGVLPAGRARLVAPGRTGVVIGWGAVKNGSHSNSSRVRRADLTIQPAGYCGRYYPQFDGTQSLCAQSPTQSPCHGDSGGPLLVADANGNVYVAGVVSFVVSCRGRLPGFFANVARGSLAGFVSRQATRLQHKADAEADAEPDVERSPARSASG